MKLIVLNKIHYGKKHLIEAWIDAAEIYDISKSTIESKLI